MSKVFWLTGPPSSGKSSIAQTFNLIRPWVVILDADDLRKNLWPELGLSEDDRKKNVLRIAWLAKKISKYDNVVVACIAPYKSVREEVKSLLGDTYKEVFVKASLDNRIQRDPKGLYEKALKGEIKELTGYNAPYEEPDCPDVVIDTDQVCLIDGGRMLSDFVDKCSS